MSTVCMAVNRLSRVWYSLYGNYHADQLAKSKNARCQSNPEA